MEMASQDQNVADVAVQLQPTCMESVNRIVKLPAVEQTIQTVHDIYGKVKDYNNLTNWTLQTAEDTVNKAVTVGKPVIVPVMKNLEGPIKKVDGALCCGLDYVEAKVPAVKLPPKEIYTNTKDYVASHVTPAVETAKSYVEPAVETAKSYVEPAVKTAKDIVEPAVKSAKDIVEPVVENVKAKVDEYLQKNVEPEAEQSDEKSKAPSADTSTDSTHAQ